MTATNRDKMTAAESGMGSPKSMEMHKAALNSATTRRGTDKHNQTMRSQVELNEGNLMMNIEEATPGARRKQRAKSSGNNAKYQKMARAAN